MTLAIIWAFARFTIWPKAASFLAAVPTKVWIGLAIFLGVWYYGHWKEEKGARECRAAVVMATQKEKTRVENVNRTVIQQSLERALKAERRNQELDKEAKDAVAELAKIKGGDIVCLPKSFTDKLHKY